MSFLKISRSHSKSFLDLLCNETVDPYDEPAPKIQKVSHKVVEYLPITAVDMEFFFSLLEDKVVAAFLLHDRFCRYADKYLLAMVLTFFKRAGLTYKEYNAYNFFVALHLAHDMEEDEEELKYEFVQWFFGSNWEEKHNLLLIKRDNLWMAMNYRGLVSRKCCEEVVAMLPEHPIWKRQRSEVYGGAQRDVDTIPKSPRSVRSSHSSRSNEYESGSESEGSDQLSTPKCEASQSEKVKSFVIDEMGRMRCSNKSDDVATVSCFTSTKSKIPVIFSVHEE